MEQKPKKSNRTSILIIVIFSIVAACCVACIMYSAFQLLEQVTALRIAGIVASGIGFVICMAVLGVVVTLVRSAKEQEQYYNNNENNLDSNNNDKDSYNNININTTQID